jgi:methyl-accepting chemotaxis protein
MGRDQRRLRNLLINPSYQLKYLFWTSFTGVALLASNAGIFYHYINENYAILVELSPMTDEAKAQLFGELNEIILKLALFSVGFLAVVGAIGLVFSHKVAGPLYHMKRVFEQVRGGDREARVRLRPKDEFQDVAREFNAMMDKIKY